MTEYFPQDDAARAAYYRERADVLDRHAETLAQTGAATALRQVAAEWRKFADMIDARQRRAPDPT